MELQRGLSTLSALGLNVIGMVGIGPFVTLSLIVAAMGGPQAMLGWILGALLSLCDGIGVERARHSLPRGRRILLLPEASLW